MAMASTRTVRRAPWPVARQRPVWTRRRRNGYDPRPEPAGETGKRRPDPAQRFRQVMETTLHRQLKALYVEDEAQREVSIGGYRVDGIVDGRLIEIQCAPLSAIRDKVGRLLADHDVHVVKPLAARKYLVTRCRKRGRITASRYSPKKETFLHLFDELVHFVRVFPHPRLTLEVILTEQEEHRIPARERRRFSRGYRVGDRRLSGICGGLKLRSREDLSAMLPAGLPAEFTTADVAGHAGIPRWLAQKMAYCLRVTGAAEVVGKRHNAVLYRLPQAQLGAGL